jgi:MtN3 and saliva related transmembrane protein
MAADLLTNVVGVGAGLCSMASFVPQIAKIVRERDAETVSLRMFAVTCAAFALWTLFGVLQGSWPIVVSNTVCLALATAIVLLRLRYGGAGAKSQA